VPTNHDWALFYREKLEWSVIPIDPKGKKPLIKWKEYIKRLPTVAEIDQWWEENPDANIGLVTGKVSGISVIDIDEHEVPGTCDYMQELYLQIMPGDKNPAWNNCYSSRTGSGGFHWFFEYEPALVSRRAIPAVDVKSDGGYVIIPPSKIGTNGYRWIRRPWKDGQKATTVIVPKMYLDIFCKNPTPATGEAAQSHVTPMSHPVASDNENKGLDPSVTQPGQNRDAGVTASDRYGVSVTFDKGGRDESLFHIAHMLFRGGMQEENIKLILDELGRRVCDPPFTNAWAKWKSAQERNVANERSLTELIEEWIYSSHGIFTTLELDRELGINSKKDKANRRKIIQRLRANKVIEYANGKSGQYRRVKTEKPPIDFVNVEMDNTYEAFVFPLMVEKWFRLMPRNIIIVSGAPDAGKTAFLLALAEKNMDRFDVQYLSSEMGAMEFRSRLDLFNWRNIQDFTKMQAYERDADFADVIRPDGVNIVDFLEIHDNFYQIGGFIKDIYNALDNGVAIIAIQKNPGVENPLGGQRAREKARLVINLDRVVADKDDDGVIEWGNCATITKAKNWRTIVNPVGLKQYYDLSDGCQFKPRGEWFK
jgi:hypothetical protein